MVLKSARLPWLVRAQPGSGRVRTCVHAIAKRAIGWITTTPRLSSIPEAIDSVATEAFMLAVLEDAVGDQEAAMRAYRRAIELSDPDVSPRAAFNLGVLLGADASAAASAYRLAIYTRHWDVAPKAAFNLGRVLERVGDRFGARLAYEQAIDFGHEDVTPNACCALALLARPRASSEEQQLGLSNM